MSDKIRKTSVIDPKPPPLSPRPPPLPRLPPILTQKVAAKNSLLTPEELERFKNLLVFARNTIEGFFAGKHKSPYRGSSVEFTDYKEYVAGDDIHRIDWRAYGRSRDLFVRQYEAETDMTVYLLMDVSASMRYAEGGRQSKYLVAAKVAAALAYLMIRQGDKTALALFAENLKYYLSPGSTHRHLHTLVKELERIKPDSTTGISRALHECASLFKKRGRIIILSDFWDNPADCFDALGQFLHRKFEILLLHVVDPHELDLPAVHTARFEDMETKERIEVEPEEIRSAYHTNMRERIDALNREANNRRMRYALVNTERPYLEALEAYLGFQGHNTMQKR